MLPAPFHAEVPRDLGHDAAWLGRGVMQALLRLRRHHNLQTNSPETAMTTPPSTRPPQPPFTRETATQKVRLAADACNSRDLRRFASINRKPIAATDRKFQWPQGHPGLSGLGL